MKPRPIASRAEVITTLGATPSLEAAARALGYNDASALRKRMRTERIGVIRRRGVATVLVEVRP